ncbi:MAG TPA: ABC transporter permease [Candidatus Limnocylindria bacterium]|nr:ABC transporter permease [Candidatus Limnocylindria bacterium]
MTAPVRADPYHQAAAAEAARRRRPSRRTVERALSVLSPIVLLAIWEAGAIVGIVDTRFFSAPTTIFAALGELLRTGEMQGHIAISLQRIAIGFVLGAVPGILLGLAIGLVPIVRAIAQPLVDATFPIPKIALLPMVMLLFGIGEGSKYAIIAIAVVFLVLINTEAGVRNIERIYFDVGRNYGASRLMFFTDIALPGALPMIMAGLKLGMGVALIVIVSAEFVAAQSGIGYLIYNSWNTFQVPRMYAGLMVIAIIGFASAVGLAALERALVPWKAGQRIS